MTVSSYETTYEAAPAATEDSMFGTPIYARPAKRQDRNNKIFLGAAAVGVLAAAGALFFATSAANDRDDAQAVAAAQPLPASRAVATTPVATPMTPAAPAAQPALRTAAVQPALRPTATARVTTAPRTRVATATATSAPSAADTGANVSAREYAPVAPEPVAAPEPAPAPVISAEPPAADPIPLIAE